MDTIIVEHSNHHCQFRCIPFAKKSYVERHDIRWDA